LKKKEEIEPLTNFDILDIVKTLKIKDFRGVFMKDALSQKVNKVESGIINLENFDDDGSHWTAYYKNDNKNIILILMDMLLLRKNLQDT
jgi:hypothetical protein